MKLLQISSMAAVAIQAQSIGDYFEKSPMDNRIKHDVAEIPFDCVNEMNGFYGREVGTLKSDLEYIPGLSTTAKVCTITACADSFTGKLVGIQAFWDNGDGQILKTSKIGRLNDLYEFDNYQGYEGETLEVLEKYWFREASPDSKEYFLNVRAKTNYDSRVKEVARLADINRDFWLTFDEF